MPTQMPGAPTPKDVSAGKEAFDAAGITDADAEKLAAQLMPGDAGAGSEQPMEDEDPFDTHMGKSIGEDWAKTPDSVKGHIRSLHDLLADSDLPDASEDMLEKEVKDVTDAAADGDKTKMLAELEDLKSKLAEMETANGSLKSENDKYQKHMLQQLVTHLKESVKAEAPDLADDEKVMASIEAYFDALKDDADLFEHAPNAVTLAVGTARKNGKKPPEPKVESREEAKAAAKEIVATAPKPSAEAEIPGMKRNPPAMSEAGADGKTKPNGKKFKNAFDEWVNT